MKVVYLLHTQKKMGNLDKRDFEQLKAFIHDQIESSNTFEEVFRNTKPVKTTFEGTEVFLARVNQHLKMVFTYKENAIYILSLIDK